MNKITVSAPGKLMLFGEHAVVYGRPCIVTAVGQRMKAQVALLAEPVFQLDAPDVQITNYQKPISEVGIGAIPKGALFVEFAIKNFVSRYPIKTGIKVTTKSQFSAQFGFGSSSASTVCVIKALSELTKKKLSNRQIFDLSYKTVLDVQGKGSGFDVAAAVYGGTLFYKVKQSPKVVRGLYFVTEGKVIKPLKIDQLPLIVGYSGIKFDTVSIVNQVAKRAKKYPWLIDNVYNQIGKLVEQAKKALLKSDWPTLGELMNFNEGLLATLGVEGNRLANMIYAAREAHSYGAKLSGAGMGDCMICLAPQSKIKNVKNAITKAGGQVINVKTNVAGVRVES